MLNKKQKEEALDTSKYFRYPFSCRKCRVIFGSDSRDNNGLCPRCQKKMKKRKVNG